jgi:ubiquinol-cytochrome c reductase cytochrome c1 subunit
MKRLKNFLFLLAAVPVVTFASEAGPHLDKAPVNLADQDSLQRGARMFVNYCLNCHSAGSMRYSRMQDLGLTEDQIKDNLLFAAEKPGETMKVGMTKTDAKVWFGATPPDLSVIARSRSADWLYTYLRGFYRRHACHRLEQHRVRQGGHAACDVEFAGRNGAGLQERGRA